MSEKEYIAYEGEAYTIEWFFDESGKSQSHDYAEALSIKEQAKLLSLLKLMGDKGQILNKEKFRSEEDQIYAFKTKPHRFLCFFIKGKKIIITNAFHKKQDKLPPNEKARALEYKKSFEERIQRGTYYEE